MHFLGLKFTDGRGGQNIWSVWGGGGISLLWIANFISYKNEKKKATKILLESTFKAFRQIANEEYAVVFFFFFSGEELEHTLLILKSIDSMFALVR